MSNEPEKPASKSDYTPEEKLRVVMEVSRLSEVELGAYLRREGLHSTQIDEWRRAMLESLADPGAQDKRSSAERQRAKQEAQRIRALERDLDRKNKALAEVTALLALQKKVQALWGGRGREHSTAERDLILGLVDEAVQAGATQDAATALLGVPPRTLQRWRKQGIGEDKRAGPRSRPANKLTEAEEQRVLGLVNSPRFRDLSPKQIVPLLADEGVYVASESTVYRLLRRNEQLAHRGRARPATHRRPDEVIATAPNQAWCWDITWLPTPVRGQFLFLYTILDVFSRKIVGWAVHDRESDQSAAALVDAACRGEGVRRDQLVMHSDNGSPMKGATMLATLQRLGIVPSFSRPGVSDDNPYIESLFRTLKYCPE